MRTKIKVTESKDPLEDIPEDKGLKEEKQSNNTMCSKDTARINTKASISKEDDALHIDTNQKECKQSVKDFLYKDAFLEGFIWE